MREIKIPLKQVKEWIDNPIGISLCIPVIVNWPELQLTEHQRICNSFALVNGQSDPFPDNSIFTVLIS